MQNRDESRLLERARCFDMEALAEIYDTFSPGLHVYASRLLNDDDLAEDCVSETYARFLQALRNGSGPRDYIQAYLYRIAHNWITDQYRRQPVPPAPLDEELMQADDKPDEEALNEIWREQVRAAMHLLTPDQRQVVMLKYVEGWENEAVATALGKPVSAVKSLQHRGLGALRRILAGEGWSGNG